MTDKTMEDDYNKMKREYIKWGQREENRKFDEQLTKEFSKPENPFNLDIVSRSHLFESGSEVQLSYGAYSNEYLFIHYGFCVENNIYDCVFVGVHHMAEHKMRRFKEATFRLVFGVPNDNIYSSYFRIYYQAVSMRLIKYCRILTCDNTSPDYINSISSISNELKALDIAISIIYDNLKNIVSDANISTYREKCIEYIKISQRRILNNQIYLLELCKNIYLNPSLLDKTESIKKWMIAEYVEQFLKFAATPEYTQPINPVNQINK